MNRTILFTSLLLLLLLSPIAYSQTLQNDSSFMKEPFLLLTAGENLHDFTSNIFLNAGKEFSSKNLIYGAELFTAYSQYGSLWKYKFFVQLAPVIGFKLESDHFAIRSNIGAGILFFDQHGGARSLSSGALFGPIYTDYPSSSSFSLSFPFEAQALLLPG